MTIVRDHYLKGKGVDILDGDINKFGKGDNYVQIGKAGSPPRLRGTSTVWKDMVGNLFGAKLESSAGKVDYDYTNNAIKFQTGGDIDTANDRVGFNLEINHDYKVGESLIFYPHIHWFQAITNETEVTDEDVTVPVVGLSVELDNIPIDGTVVVEDATDTTTYTEDTDYSIDYENGTLTNLTLTAGVTVHVDYNYITGTVTTKPFVMTARYRVQRNGYEQVTDWTEITCEVGAGGDDMFDFSDKVSGTYNQLSNFDAITIDCGVSDTFQFQMARTDSEVGDMVVYFLDVHGEVDSLGSEDIITKED